MRDQDKYSKIINLFTDPNKASMRYAFCQGDYVIATDTYAAIFIPQLFIPDLPIDPNQKPPNALAILPKASNQNIIFKTAYLRNKIDILKTRLSKKYKEKKWTCQDCMGTGQVEFKFFSSITYEEHCTEDDCPTCEGKGSIIRTINLKENTPIIGNAYAIINIGTAYFELSVFEKLVTCAELFNKEEVNLTYRVSGESVHAFLVGDIIILLMPLRNRKEDEKVIVKINH